MTRPGLLWLAAALAMAAYLAYLATAMTAIAQAAAEPEEPYQVPVIIRQETVREVSPVLGASLTVPLRNPPEVYTVTAYSNGVQSTGKRPGDAAYGITYSGLPARLGVCAVDPDVIPLGSVLWVQEYGLCAALDVGSAIQGRHVDVWLPSEQAASEWGVKRLMVAVVR